MYCSHCGTQVPQGARHCPNCGRSLTAGRGASRWWSLLFVPVILLAGAAAALLLTRNQSTQTPSISAATAAAPTATVMPTATPGGLLTSAGTGPGVTPAFTVSGAGWVAQYTWDCTHGQATGTEEFIFGLALADASSGQTAAYVYVPDGTSGHATHSWKNIGTFRLNVLTEPGCTWSVHVPNS